MVPLELPLLEAVPLDAPEEEDVKPDELAWDDPDDVALEEKPPDEDAAPWPAFTHLPVPPSGTWHSNVKSQSESVWQRV